MAEEDNGGKLLWFVAGAAVGAAIAVLYAPAAGEEIRRKIAEKTDQGRQALADQGRDLYDRTREMYERGRKLADEAAEMVERGRKLVEGVAGTGQGQEPAPGQASSGNSQAS
jgi:gas vesicle protein